MDSIFPHKRSITVNNFRAIIGAFFEYAVRRELVDKNPVMPVEKIKVIDAAPEIFMPQQLTRCFSALLAPYVSIQICSSLAP